MVAPANDNWADAAEITLDGSGAFTSPAINNAEATKETGEPAVQGVATPWHSVWWKFTPTADGALDLDTQLTTSVSGSTDTVLGVYTGSSLATLTEVASDDDSGGSGTSKVSGAAVTAGTTYYVQVFSLSSSMNLNYVLRVAGTVAAAPQRYDNDGYSYTGGAVVDDDPPVDLPPVHAREDIDRAHQSLPAPTLVDGRPT